MVNTKGKMKNALLASAALCGCAALLAPAYAQSADNPYMRDRFTAVTDRYQPAFDPEPRRIGGLVLNGDLGLAVRQDSNIYARNTGSVGRIEDTIFVIAPQVMLRTDWSNHQIDAGFNAESRQYQDQSDESATDVNGYVGGRLDVTRDFRLRGQVGAQQAYEQRYAPSNLGNYAEQPEVKRTTGEVSAELFRDRLRVQGTIGASTEDLGVVPLVEGGSIDLNFRDYTNQYVSGRVSYAMSPNLAVFVLGRADTIDYDRAGTAERPDRDVDRMTALVGVNFELAAPFRGEIGVGYIQEDKFGSDADFDGLSANARVQWFITELTTLTFGANRDVYDPGVPNARTVVSTRLQARADHEFLRNVLGFVDVESENREFQDINRTDDLVYATIGAAYKLNKRARLEASYARRQMETNSDPAFAQDFDQNVFSLGVRFFP